MSRGGLVFGLLLVVASFGGAVFLAQAGAPPKEETAASLSGAAALPAPARPAASTPPGGHGAAAGTGPALWQVYEQSLRRARYVDLTHAVTPSIPVWPGFRRSTFGPALDAKTGRPFTYARDGFEATRYELATDQLGTQLDPPAHWDPNYPAIDELPPTFAVRPLVVISIVAQVARDPGYPLAVADVLAWEARHGRIPAGAVVFVRSDWSKEWPNPDLATRQRFPGVSLAALQFLHRERQILMHGHEPLDTDTTPNLEGESWLMHHGFTQAEGLANLDQVPEAGALVAIGYPKLQGGTGGYARYVAICPPDWPHGVTIDQAPGAPLPRQDRPLHWDAKLGMRVR
jgi:kynurenine formamidase